MLIIGRPQNSIYNIAMPTMEHFFCGFTLWLGAYLLARGSPKATVQLTGGGLLAYALVLAIQIIFTPSILLISRTVIARRGALAFARK